VITWFHAVRAGAQPSLAAVTEALLVGEYLIPSDVPWLVATHRITAVVSLQDDADLASKNLRLADLERAYRDHGLHFDRVPVPDGDTEILAARLDQLVTLLAARLDAGGRVYLHCNAGYNRAPTVAIAYLHVRGGLPLLAARDLVKSRRQCVPYMRALEARFGVSRP
jgi:protein-tyrosine phosphatase